ncbi:hypothetical protein LCGC14_2670390 [marine sediment metagenome]|uniref:Calcineurin-like phosphoesterase domain-containing protein n=1 Tax=marine sediment metagenome TaxID=412755 RepID=A0A0F8ZPA3_9ZZZZ
MELVYYARTLRPTLKNVIVVPISDAHYGNPYFSKRHFLETLRYVKNTPNVYAVPNGDLCESSIRTSKGEIFRQVGSPQDQRDWIIEKLYPIRHKILGMTTGNHEARIYNEVGIDMSKDIAVALGVPYRPEGMLLKISFGSGNNGMPDRPFVYWGYATHGYGGARTKSAKAVKVERVATWIHADFYIMSHDHVVNVAPDVYLLPDNRTYLEKDGEGEETGFIVGKVVAQRKMLIKSNAYLKWGGYAEQGGFPPSDLTTPVITLMGDTKKRVKVEV